MWVAVASWRLHRVIAPLVALALVAGTGITAPRAAQAADLLPTTTAVQPPSLDPKPVGRTVGFVATVTPATTGTVEFYDDTTLVGTADLNLNSKAVYALPADMALGTHPMWAKFLGNATHAESTSSLELVEVGPRDVIVELRVSGPHDQFGHTAMRGDALWASVWVTDPGLLWPTGTVTLLLDGVGVGSMPVDQQNLQLQTAGWTLGTHTLVAHYDPGTSLDHVAKDSAPFTINLSDNAVEAFVSTPTNPTFYPVKDGYKDTTTVRGGRDETASVVVRILSPTGKPVQQVSIPAGTGAWSVRWKGRTASGALLAAGTYTVKHIVTDATGLKRTFVQTVKLSHKRFYSQTVTLTKRFSKAARSTSTWIAWSFALPSAPIYTSLTFSIYGKDDAASGGYGPQAFTSCATTTWDPGCASPSRHFPASYKWVSVAGSTRYNRSGRTVRLYAWGGFGNTRIEYGRVKVVYGYLR